MSGFEFNANSYHAAVPREGILAAVINQAFSRRAQIVQLHSINIVSFDDSGDFGLRQHAVRLFFFEIFQRLIVIVSVNFLTG
ncbi:hypothetical protein NO1_0741 [Candidatus Termititenax aidoneus]|uniref:Uncharacterized protein n=1 Tax=Termititenax aidoneus TaxID=2218524 RepID=A0A388TAR2_TERA1|nr:hypothetical protein NO1_0741 [Candidatus Termititenax aidoneus]